jgi:hypothetical protein
MSLQPWFVAIVGFFALLIAYFQWRTAHQRVVLDLFDRRIKVFEIAEAACAKIASSSPKPPSEALLQLHEAKGKARFLFGDDVNAYLQARIKDCAFLMSLTSEVIESDPLNREKLIDKQANALLRIADFQQTAPSIFARYMRLHQKMPSTWFPF